MFKYQDAECEQEINASVKPLLTPTVGKLPETLIRVNFRAQIHFSSGQFALNLWTVSQVVPFHLYHFYYLDSTGI